MQFSMVKSTESPYGSFSTYTSALPYFREKDENGNYYRTLSLNNVAPPGMELGVSPIQQSPMYEAKYLNSFTAGETMSFTNNTGINWSVTPDFRIKGNMRYSVNLGYGQTNGVMKGSTRSTYEAGTKFSILFTFIRQTRYPSHPRRRNTSVPKQ